MLKCRALNSVFLFPLISPADFATTYGSVRPAGRRQAVNALEFIASLVGSLAWPITILAGLLIFRRPITSRISSIRRIAYKEAEVLFDEKALEVRAALSASNAPNEAFEFEYVASEVTRGAKSDQIINAWAELEEQVRQRLARSGIDPQGLTGDELLATARSRGVLTSEQWQALKGLRTLRNLAAHRFGPELEDRRIHEFMVLADAMQATLQITEPPSSHPIPSE